MPLYQAPSSRRQASRLLSVDLHSGWVELNWLRGPILRRLLFISCIPPIFSHSRKEMYTSTSPITINFEIITQYLTTHRPCDIIPDYKVPSVNWFVRKSTFNAWHTPKGSQALLREGRQHWTLVSGNHSCFPVWDRMTFCPGRCLDFGSESAPDGVIHRWLS